MGCACGKWVILRTGYTLTGATWSKWHAYPEGDTFKGGEGYLKQTATAAHVYGKRQAEAEAFTNQEKDGTHWSLGPSDLKPYANDAFCEGINRLMLHEATCQPPSDGKPGYEFCAGQHFTPNITWWEQSSAFFTYLSRCQYMLQQGKFVGDVCFYLGVSSYQNLSVSSVPSNAMSLPEIEKLRDLINMGATVVGGRP